MGIIIIVACRSGGMADAHGSGPCVGNYMRVQVPSSALDMEALEYRSTSELFFYPALAKEPWPKGDVANEDQHCDF